MTLAIGERKSHLLDHVTGQLLGEGAADEDDDGEGPEEEPEDEEDDQGGREESGAAAFDLSSGFAATAEH